MFFCSSLADHFEVGGHNCKVKFGCSAESLSFLTWSYAARTTPPLHSSVATTTFRPVRTRALAMDKVPAGPSVSVGGSSDGKQGKPVTRRTLRDSRSDSAVWSSSPSRHSFSIPRFPSSRWTTFSRRPIHLVRALDIRGGAARGVRLIIFLFCSKGWALLQPDHSILWAICMLRCEWCTSLLLLIVPGYKKTRMHEDSTLILNKKTQKKKKKIKNIFIKRNNNRRLIKYNKIIL